MIIPPYLSGLRVSRTTIATILAILFHAVGLMVIVYYPDTVFARATGLNLLLMFLLILWTQPGKNKPFFLFIFAAFSIGMVAEIIGVNTGLLFGSYHYSKIMGPGILSVPFLIGINWFIIIYCIGITINTILQRLIKKAELQTGLPPIKLKAISLIVDGASLAMFFDWVMEPVAVKLGFWQWQENSIPFFNFSCWFLVSALILTAFQFCPFPKKNKFAVHLLMIQFMFFLILRTIL